jgi:hypothetical protein
MQGIARKWKQTGIQLLNNVEDSGRSLEVEGCHTPYILNCR